MVDYYETLQLPRDADADDIRKAFRHLAFRYHPDKAGNCPDAADRFRRIRQAYETLQDPLRRVAYDAELTTAEEQQEPEFDFIRNVQATRAQTKPTPTRSARRRQPFEYHAVNCTPEQQPQSHLDIKTTLGIHLADSLPPTRYTVRLEDRSHGQNRIGRYTVKIPGKLWDGAFLYVAGLGTYDPIQNRQGNLFITIKFLEHDYYRVQGNNIYADVYIYPWEAKLGTTVEIPALDGYIPLSVPQPFIDRTLVRLREHGLYDKFGQRGDLNVVLRAANNPKLAERTNRLWRTQQAS